VVGGNRTVRYNYVTWGLIVAALWGIAALVCAQTRLDILSVSAATVATCLTAPGRMASRIRLEDLPGLEAQILSESMSGEKLLYRLAMSHGWQLRNDGLDIKGEPLNEPDRFRPDIDNTGGSPAHQA
jgi:hypothetical protein